MTKTRYVDKIRFEMSTMYTKEMIEHEEHKKMNSWQKLENPK